MLIVHIPEYISFSWLGSQPFSCEIFPFTWPTYAQELISAQAFISLKSASCAYQSMLAIKSYRFRRFSFNDKLLLFQVLEQETQISMDTAMSNRRRSTLKVSFILPPSSTALLSKRDLILYGSLDTVLVVDVLLQIAVELSVQWLDLRQ